MIVLTALLLTLLLTGWVLPRQLARTAWETRAPRAAIASWAALILTATTTSVMIVHRAFTADHHGRGPLGWLVPAALKGSARGDYDHPQAFGLGLAAMAALLGIVAAGWVRGARAQRRHRQQLDLVGHPHDGGWLVLDSAVPAAWCVPGDGGRIVLTAGALTLEARHREAVLAHEGAHLRGRHHLLTAAATALGHRLRLLPAARLAGRRIPALVEMAADDRALRTTTPRALAEALYLVATAGTPSGSLAASGEATVERVRRLLAPATRLPRAARICWWAGAVVLPAVPVLIACGP
nr:M56 family metallopeptidase [Kitasatospora purpeofusca]